VYQAGSFPVRRAAPVVDEAVGGDCPAAVPGHQRSHSRGDWGGCPGLSRWSPQSGQRPSCLVSRRRL
jgi:hypothetical protein